MLKISSIAMRLTSCLPDQRLMVVVGFSVLCAVTPGCVLPRFYSQNPPSREALEQLEPTTAQEQQLADADAAKEQGEYKVALAMFRDLLAENPTLTGAYLGMGDIYLAEGEYSQSERHYGRAARLEPRNYDAQFGHGVALKFLERFTEAIDAFFRALTIRPDSVEANQNLATTYLQLDQPRSALVFAEKTVELDPDNADARINLGSVYEKLGRYEDAITQYESSLELTEPTPELLKNMLSALASDRRYLEALNTAEFLIELEPTANAYERQGWAYFRLREYDKSIQAYRKAVELDPTHWVSQRGIGINALNAWLLSDRTDQQAAAEAKTALRESLRLNPDQPRLVQILATYQL